MELLFAKWRLARRQARQAICAGDTSHGKLPCGERRAHRTARCCSGQNHAEEPGPDPAEALRRRIAEASALVRRADRSWQLAQRVAEQTTWGTVTHEEHRRGTGSEWAAGCSSCRYCPTAIEQVGRSHSAAGTAKNEPRGRWYCFGTHLRRLRATRVGRRRRSSRRIRSARAPDVLRNRQRGSQQFVKP